MRDRSRTRLLFDAAFQRNAVVPAHAGIAVPLPRPKARVETLERQIPQRIAPTKRAIFRHDMLAAISSFAKGCRMT